MAHRRGDVLLVPFPFSDLSTTKVRPALVVSGTQYHKQEPDLILCPITSKTVALKPLDYLLRDWVAAGLKFASAFKPVLFTLDPARVIHSVGRLSKRDMDEIDARLRLMLQV